MTCLVAQTVKRLPAMRETRLRSLGWEDLLEKEMATHSSILAWRIPQMEEPGRLQSMGSQRVRHDWATSLTQQHIKVDYRLQTAPSFALKGQRWKPREPLRFTLVMDWASWVLYGANVKLSGRAPLEWLSWGLMKLTCWNRYSCSTRITTNWCGICRMWRGDATCSSHSPKSLGWWTEIFPVSKQIFDYILTDSF